MAKSIVTFPSLGTVTSFNGGKMDEFSHEIARGLDCVYLLPEVPFWFMVGPEGDRVLGHLTRLEKDGLVKVLMEECGMGAEEALLEAQHLFASITLPDLPPYRGRGQLEPEMIKELWFHLLDACNLACSHCLFSRERQRKRVLPLETVSGVIRDALGQGLELVCLTGGEPLLYPDLLQLLKTCIDDYGLEVAILTNGILLDDLVGALPGHFRERLHFQVSIDGPEEIHDGIRGKGAFKRMAQGVSALLKAGFSVTASMTVNSVTIKGLLEALESIVHMGVKNMHLMWHFDEGSGRGMSPGHDHHVLSLFSRFLKRSDELGVEIDNLRALRSQLFSPPGTRFDLGNGGWESLTIGPDGAVWPTPARVDRRGFLCGRLGGDGAGILEIWRNSKVLKAIRSMSLLDSPAMKKDPWRFIIGGGDPDHCLKPKDEGAGLFLSEDPQRPFYLEMLRHLLELEASDLPVPPEPLGVRLKMGDVMDGCGHVKEVNFIHSNCLLSLGSRDGRGLVREFYGRRAQSTDDSIKNPTLSAMAGIDLLPKENVSRSYGCGSPVEDARLREGEWVLDLGSGSGVECLIGAKKVGRHGMVVGIDMTDEMLALAASGKRLLVEEMGYDNIAFLKAHLEGLPLRDESFHCIISNCVINLTKNKRRVLKEAFRTLRPGGRIVISDVVTPKEPPPWVRSDRELIGGCLGGALVESYLFAMLKDIGFEGSRVIRRFPYKEVSGHMFFSLTFEAFRPRVGADLEKGEKRIGLILKGPLERVVLEDGRTFSKGEIFYLEEEKADALPSDLFLRVSPTTGETLGQDGAVSGCGCRTGSSRLERKGPKETSGCLICGAPIVYMDVPQRLRCSICGTIKLSSSKCKNGHFCCDLCHIEDPLEVIRKICLNTTETDMIALMKRIRANRRFPLHGPEHHAMVPGIMLSTYRNLGGDVREETLLFAIERGARMPGGSCGDMGACGAAVGVGVGFSALLGSTPLASRTRARVNRIVAEVLQKIAERDAPRCCQRESYIALKEAERISRGLLDRPLVARESILCAQSGLNKECIKGACPLYPRQ